MKKTYSDRYEELIPLYIESEKLPSISEIQKEHKIGFKMASAIYKECKNYHDEVYWHNCIYEISFMEEPPTPARIMSLFGVSYYFAKKLFDYYIEAVNDK